jgi:hypothetical protein
MRGINIDRHWLNVDDRRTFFDSARWSARSMFRRTQPDPLAATRRHDTSITDAFALPLRESMFVLKQ